MIGRCAVSKCGETSILARGWCKLHYDRWYRHGDPTVVTQERTATERNTPEYRAWKSIKTRCYNKKLACYNRYGGRGIKVCERWMKSYFAFLEDMGRRPTNEHSIDRVNNDGHYEPANCRWATQYEQVLNQGMRADNKSGVRGLYWNNRTKKWCVSLNRDRRLVLWGSFDSKDAAISKIDNYLKGA